MNRFFKSAAFPILLVVVLAFFFTKLASTGTSGGRSHSYQTLSPKNSRRAKSSPLSSRTRVKFSKSS